MNSLTIAQSLLRRTLRNPKEAVALLVLPVLVIAVIAFLLGKAGQGDLRVGYVNLDAGVLGEKMVSHLKDQPKVKTVEITEDKYIRELKNNKVDSVVVIPESFSSDIEAGKNVSVELYASKDGIGPQRVKLMVNQYVQTLYRVVELANSTEGSIQDKATTIINILGNVENGLVGTADTTPGGENTKPGLQQAMGFSLVFMMVLVFTSMGTIMEDKKRLTLARMYVSAIREWEIIAGNLLGSLALAVLQLLPLVLVLKFVFNIPWGPCFSLFLLLLCFLVTAIGLGIGLSGLLKKDVNPTILIATIIVPSSILGGCFIPEAMLPSIFNTIGWFVPQKWVMKGVEQLLNGSGILAVFTNLGVLLLFGLGFAVIGWKSLRPLQEG